MSRFIARSIAFGLYYLVYNRLEARRDRIRRACPYGPQHANVQSDSQLHWTAVGITAAIAVLIPTLVPLIGGALMVIVMCTGLLASAVAPRSPARSSDPDSPRQVAVDSPTRQRTPAPSTPDRTTTTTTTTTSDMEIDSFEDAFAALEGGGAFPSINAIRWLAKQPVNQRKTEVVTAALGAMGGVHDTDLASLIERRFDDTTAPLVLAKLDDPSAHRYSQLIKMLGRKNHVAAAPKLMALAANGTSGSASVISGLELMGPEVGPLIAPYLLDADADVRNTAKIVLARKFADDDLSTAQMVRGLASPDKTVRGLALDWFNRRTANEQYRSQVAEALNVCLADPQQRSDALRVFDKWGGPENIPTLIIALDSNQSSSHDSQIIEALGDSGDPRAAEALVKHFGDSYKRIFVTRALRKLGPIAEPYLLPQVTANDERMVGEVCAILGDVGGEASLDALETAYLHGQRNQWSRVTVSAQTAFLKVKQRVASTPRLWTDASGKFQVEAVLIDFKDGKAVLKVSDGGRTISLALADLSQPDQTFIRALLKKRS